MSATFNKGGNNAISFHGDLVIFIDCAPGGFNTTSQFIDNDNRLARDVSGRNPQGTQRAVANFAPGFYADYAIAVGVNSGGAVYKINQTDSGQTLEYRGNPNFQPTYNENLPTYTFYFNWDWIGMTQSPTNFFKFESLYATEGGGWYPESFESLTASGSAPWGTINFSNYDVFGIDPVPETTNGALMAFGGLFLTVGVLSQVKQRLRSQKRE